MWMLQAIYCTIPDIDSVGYQTTLSTDRAKALEWRVELVYRDLIAKEVTGELAPKEQEALPFIANAYLHLWELVQSIELLLLNQFKCWTFQLEGLRTTSHTINWTH